MLKRRRFEKSLKLKTLKDSRYQFTKMHTGTARVGKGGGKMHYLRRGYRGCNFVTG